jgi:hypothetical protein
MRYRNLRFCLFAGILGCGGGSTGPGFAIGFMAMAGNTTNGAYALTTGSSLNGATGSAFAACGAFCSLVGTCAWTSADPTSPTFGALARSGLVTYLGQQQYFFGYGCAQSPTDAAAKAVVSCASFGFNCTVLNGLSLIPNKNSAPLAVAGVLSAVNHGW